jgi:hypothetical protein
MRRLFLAALVVLPLAFQLVAAPCEAAQRAVVAEEFTGTWCYYCPGAMMGLHNLLMEVGDSLAVVAYHLSDAFTVTGCTVRQGYYNVTGIPDVWFDGVIERLGGNHTTPINYRSYFNQRKVVDSPVTMEITLEDYDGSTGLGHVKATVTNVSQSAVTGKLRLVATGDDSLYNWQGFDHLYFTALDIFPDAQGVDVNVAPGGVFETTEEFQLPTGWRDRACTVMGFVQDDVTKEVLQGGSQHEIVAIELAGFSASVTADGVLLSWQTLSEESNAGFKVYRSEGAEYRSLCAGLIPGNGTTSVPQDYAYLDESVEPGGTYWYKISDVSLSGTETFHGPIRIDVATPAVLALGLGADPTPADHTVSLRFHAPTAGVARMSVFDVRGRFVKDVLASRVEAGAHVVQWDLTDRHGDPVGSGQYVCRLEVGSQAASARVVVVR